MSLIQVTDLTFAYDGSYDNVFEHTFFQFDTDWKLGFLGRNGRGKTTFLRLLMGEYPCSGAISAPVPFDCFPFPVPDRERLTLELLEDLASEVERWQICRELAAMEVDEEVLCRPFSTLSGGEQTKVLLSLLFLREGRFLLIDEPTNHLDLEGRRVVSQYLKRQRGFLLVSHDRAFLDGCVDHVITLNRKSIDVQQGNFSFWWENKERRDAWERAEHEKLRRDITRLDAAARRTADWSDAVEATKKGTRNSGLRPDRGYVGHKAAKLMKRSKAVAARRQAAVAETSALLQNVESADPLKLHPLFHPKRRLAEALGLAPDYGGGPVCRPVSFTVEQGDRVALSGRNGAGKSSLLKLFTGGEIPHCGTLTLAPGLVVSVVPQDAAFLKGSLTAYAETCGVDLTLFLTLLRKLDFSRIQFEKDMSDFSAGQKKKVLLTRSLCQKAHLYVWDEPLNYIDVFSRMQIEALLQSYGPTMLLVEHDRTFLNTAATKIVALE